MLAKDQLKLEKRSIHIFFSYQVRSQNQTGLTTPDQTRPDQTVLEHYNHYNLHNHYNLT